MLPDEILLIIYSFCDKLTQARFYRADPLILRHRMPVPYAYRIVLNAIRARDHKTLRHMLQYVQPDARYADEAVRYGDMHTVYMVAIYKKMGSYIWDVQTLMTHHGVLGMKFMLTSDMNVQNWHDCVQNKNREVAHYMISINMCDRYQALIAGASIKRIPSHGAKRMLYMHDVSSSRILKMLNAGIPPFYLVEVVRNCRVQVKDLERLHAEGLVFGNVLLEIIRCQRADLLTNHKDLVRKIFVIEHALDVPDLEWMRRMEFDMSQIIPTKSMETMNWMLSIYPDKTIPKSSITKLDKHVYMQLLRENKIQFVAEDIPNVVLRCAECVTELLQTHPKILQYISEWIQDDYHTLVSCALKLGYRFDSNITTRVYGQKTYLALHKHGYSHVTDLSRHIDLNNVKCVKRALGDIPCIKSTNSGIISEILDRHNKKFDF
jgi:hypothetical protein